jgi:murein L,D-transpeptidase YcbB/YkuD
MTTKYQRFTRHHRHYRRPSIGQVLFVWATAGLLGAGVAHADADGDERGLAQQTASILASAGDDVIATGMKRILPVMARREGARRARTTWRAELDEVLLGQESGLNEYYSEEGTPIFTDSEGFTAIGRRVFALLHEAPYHGLSHLQSSLQKIREFSREMKRQPKHQRVASSADPGELVEAWNDSKGTDDRLASTAAVLGARHAGFAAAAHSATLQAQRMAVRQARLEVGLAASLTNMASHMLHRPWIGGTLRDDDRQEISPDALWFADPSPLSPDEVESLFEAAQRSDETLWEWFEERLPKGEQYMGLVGAARHYATLCSRGGWEKVRAPWAIRGRQWKDKELITQVQRRLSQEGFLAAEPSGVYDDATIAAMKVFRKSHQIRAGQGTFDKEVAAAMNIPCERKLQIVLLNLRRWRHTARTDEATYVEVNISSMEVSLVIDGEEVARERTAVGSGKARWNPALKKYSIPQATPIMQGAIERVVVNPWWNVPGSIYEGEYKRKIDNDPTWLERNNYVLKPTALGARLIQLPGPRNSLGQLKMVFQNDASIYLHDTPKKGWFKYDRRDVSHGCIRVQNVFDFASKVVVNDRVKQGRRFGTRQLLQMAKANTSHTQAIALAEPVRVFLEYYTASVDKDGHVMFHPDIYDYDRNVLDGPRTRHGKRR